MRIILKALLKADHIQYHHGEGNGTLKHPISSPGRSEQGECDRILYCNHKVTIIYFTLMFLLSTFYKRVRYPYQHKPSFLHCLVGMYNNVNDNVHQRPGVHHAFLQTSSQKRSTLTEKLESEGWNRTRKHWGEKTNGDCGLAGRRFS